jgi:hypothetical protein
VKSRMEVNSKSRGMSRMPVIFHMHVGTSEHPPHHKSIDVIFLRSVTRVSKNMWSAGDYDVSDLPPISHGRLSNRHWEFETVDSKLSAE